MAAFKACQLWLALGSLGINKASRWPALPSADLTDLSASELCPIPLQGALEVCHALLRFAVQHSVDAIIDCGALLAGTTNR